MSPALNGSSALERFERSNAIKIHNGIMFDFYPGLPHVIKHHLIRTGLIPRPSLAPVFDHLQYAKTEGEELGTSLIHTT